MGSFSEGNIALDYFIREWSRPENAYREAVRRAEWWRSKGNGKWAREYDSWAATIDKRYNLGHEETSEEEVQSPKKTKRKTRKTKGSDNTVK